MPQARARRFALVTIGLLNARPPQIKKLMGAARAAGAPVIYTSSGTGNPAKIAGPIA
jgi:hypothetical protein